MTAPKWYDGTCKASEIDRDSLITALKSWKADKFVIGHEFGHDTGYEHWQLRVVFKKPTTMETLLKFNIENGVTCHWTPTHVHDFAYCEKEGEYYRSWEGALGRFRDIKLNSWQGQAVADLAEQNDRQVTVIVDEEGCTGKSWLAKHLVVKYGYAYVPAMKSFEDYMFMAMAHSEAKGFVIDVPRADDMEKKAELWMALETIKNGYLYDKRYNFREMWIEPPKMLVLANERPPKSALSKDRWREYYIDDSWGCLTLEKYQEVTA